jgi:hypothetical protein
MNIQSINDCSQAEYNINTLSRFSNSVDSTCNEISNTIKTTFSPIRQLEKFKPYLLTCLQQVCDGKAKKCIIRSRKNENYVIFIHSGIVIQTYDSYKHCKKDGVYFNAKTQECLFNGMSDEQWRHIFEKMANEDLEISLATLQESIQEIDSVITAFICSKISSFFHQHANKNQPEGFKFFQETFNNEIYAIFRTKHGICIQKESDYSKGVHTGLYFSKELTPPYFDGDHTCFQLAIHYEKLYTMIQQKIEKSKQSSYQTKAVSPSNPLSSLTIESSIPPVVSSENHSADTLLLPSASQTAPLSPTKKKKTRRKKKKQDVATSSIPSSNKSPLLTSSSSTTGKELNKHKISIEKQEKKSIPIIVSSKVAKNETSDLKQETKIETLSTSILSSVSITNQLANIHREVNHWLKQQSFNFSNPFSQAALKNALSAHDDLWEDLTRCNGYFNKEGLVECLSSCIINLSLFSEQLISARLLEQVEPATYQEAFISLSHHQEEMASMLAINLNSGQSACIQKLNYLEIYFRYLRNCRHLSSPSEGLQMLLALEQLRSEALTVSEQQKIIHASCHFIIKHYKITLTLLEQEQLLPKINGNSLIQILADQYQLHIDASIQIKNLPTDIEMSLTIKQIQDLIRKIVHDSENVNLSPNALCHVSDLCEEAYTKLNLLYALVHEKQLNPGLLFKKVNRLFFPAFIKIACAQAIVNGFLLPKRLPYYLNSHSLPDCLTLFEISNQQLTEEQKKWLEESKRVWNLNRYLAFYHSHEHHVSHEANDIKANLLLANKIKKHSVIHEEEFLSEEGWQTNQSNSKKRQLSIQKQLESQIVHTFKIGYQLLSMLC